MIFCTKATVCGIDVETGLLRLFKRHLDNSAMLTKYYGQAYTDWGSQEPDPYGYESDEEDYDSEYGDELEAY